MDRRRFSLAMVGHAVRRLDVRLALGLLAVTGPIAHAYMAVTPDPVRDRVSAAVNNPAVPASVPAPVTPAA